MNQQTNENVSYQHSIFPTLTSSNQIPQQLLPVQQNLTQQQYTQVIQQQPQQQPNQFYYSQIPISTPLQQQHALRIGEPQYYQPPLNQHQQISQQYQSTQQSPQQIQQSQFNPQQQQFFITTAQPQILNQSRDQNQSTTSIISQQIPIINQSNQFINQSSQQPSQLQLHQFRPISQSTQLMYQPQQQYIIPSQYQQITQQQFQQPQQFISTIQYPTIQTIPEQHIQFTLQQSYQPPVINTISNQQPQTNSHLNSIQSSHLPSKSPVKRKEMIVQRQSQNSSSDDSNSPPIRVNSKFSPHNEHIHHSTTTNKRPKHAPLPTIPSPHHVHPQLRQLQPSNNITPHTNENHIVNDPNLYHPPPTRVEQHDAIKPIIAIKKIQDQNILDSLDPNRPTHHTLYCFTCHTACDNHDRHLAMHVYYFDLLQQHRQLHSNQSIEQSSVVNKNIKMCHVCMIASKSSNIVNHVNGYQHQLLMQRRKDGILDPISTQIPLPKYTTLSQITKDNENIKILKNTTIENDIALHRQEQLENELTRSTDTQLTSQIPNVKPITPIHLITDENVLASIHKQHNKSRLEKYKLWCSTCEILCDKPYHHLSMHELYFHTDDDENIKRCHVCLIGSRSTSLTSHFKSYQHRIRNERMNDQLLSRPSLLLQNQQHVMKKQIIPQQDEISSNHNKDTLQTVSPIEQSSIDSNSTTIDQSQHDTNSNTSSATITSPSRNSVGLIVPIDTVLNDPTIGPELQQMHKKYINITKYKYYCYTCNYPCAEPTHHRSMHDAYFSFIEKYQAQQELLQQQIPSSNASNDLDTTNNDNNDTNNINKQQSIATQIPSNDSSSESNTTADATSNESTTLNDDVKLCHTCLVGVKRSGYTAHIVSPQHCFRSQFTSLLQNPTLMQQATENEQKP